MLREPGNICGQLYRIICGPGARNSEFGAFSGSGPLAAIGIARRHARLVGIELGFGRAFERAKLGLDEACMQKPADATELGAGMPARFN